MDEIELRDEILEQLKPFVDGTPEPGDGPLLPFWWPAVSNRVSVGSLNPMNDDSLRMSLIVSSGTTAIRVRPCARARWSRWREWGLQTIQETPEEETWESEKGRANTGGHGGA